MDEYYFILIDINEPDLRSQILKSVNNLKLTRACIEVKKEFAHGVPFEIPYSLIFFSEHEPDQYCKNILERLPDAFFIHLNQEFYYDDTNQVIGLPEHQLDYYFKRAFFTMYTSHNNRRASKSHLLLKSLYKDPAEQ